MQRVNLHNKFIRKDENTFGGDGAGVRKRHELQPASVGEDDDLGVQNPPRSQD